MIGWRSVFNRRIWRRIPLVWVVGLLLTVLSLGLFVTGMDLVDALSNKLYDALLRNIHSAPQSGRVAIVDIDENSLDQYGQWPWPRYLTAQLTQTILAGHPSVVGFDIVFAEPDRTSPEQLRIGLSRSFDLDVQITGLPPEMADYDRLLARALAGGTTILGCAMHPTDAMVAAPPPTAIRCTMAHASSCAVLRISISTHTSPRRRI